MSNSLLLTVFGLSLMFPFWVGCLGFRINKKVMWFAPHDFKRLIQLLQISFSLTVYLFG